MKYRAFISYRRQDASAAARWLREKLLGFRPPKELLDHVTPERRVDLERRLAYFLDTSYQSANEDFWTGNIEPALKESEYLIVISSPAALQARPDGSDNWVAREIDTFLKVWGEEEGRRRIIVVLSSGAAEDRYPGRLNALGDQWDWADLRDVSRLAALRPGAAERLGDALLKIVARIHEVPQDLLPILRREEARKRGRLRVAVGSAAAVLIAGLSVLSWWAVSAQREAARQRDAALVREARFLAKAAQTELTNRHHTTALALALESLPRDMAKGDRPYAREAEWMAQASLQSQMLSIAEWSRQDSSLRSSSAGILLPGDDRMLVARPDGTLLLVDAASGRTIAPMPGHRAEITGVSVSRSGNRALSVSRDGTARLWDLTATGQPSTVFDIGEPARLADLSRDGSRVLVAGERIAVFDVATRRRTNLPELPPYNDIRAAILSPDGRFVLVTTLSDKVFLLQVGSEEILDLSPPDLLGRPNSVAFSDDGRLVLFSVAPAPMGRGHHAAYLANIATRSVITLNTGKHTFDHAQFTPDGSGVLTVGPDGAQLWSVPGGLEEWFAPLDRGGSSATYAPDGKTIFVANGKFVAVLDALTGARVMSLFGHTEPVASIVASRDGKSVLSLSDDRTARLWDLASGTGRAVIRHDDSVSTGYLSADGRRIVTSTWDGAVKLWHVNRGPFGPMVPAPGNYGTLQPARFTPDGGFLLAHTFFGGLHVWSMPSGSLHREAYSRLPRIFGLAISGDGSRLIATGLEAATIWSIPDLKHVATLDVPHAHELRFAVLSHDGTLALTRTDRNEVKLWDVASRKARFTLEGPDEEARTIKDKLQCLSFSRDGKRVLVTASNGTALLDSADGRAVLTLRERQTACAVFSPDARQVLVARSDGRVTMFEADSGRESGTLADHAGETRRIAFAPRGDRALTVDNDAVRIWSMPDGRELATLRGHADRPTGAAFSPDGARVLTIARDRTALLWQVEGGRTVGSFAFDTIFDADTDDVGFSPAGDRVIISNGGVVRVWPHLRSTQEVIDRGCGALVQPLSRAQRRELFLDEDPKDPPCGWHPDAKVKPRYVPKAATR